MDFSNSPSTKIETVNSLSNAINACCDAINDALNVTFDKVSWFASNMWSGVKKWWIFVDVIIRNLILISRHFSDLSREIWKGVEFVTGQVVEMLYDIESKITKYLIENHFFYENFGRLAEWIISLSKNIRYNLIIR